MKPGVDLRAGFVCEACAHVPADGLVAARGGDGFSAAPLNVRGGRWGVCARQLPGEGTASSLKSFVVAV